MKTKASDVAFVALLVAALVWSCTKTTILDQIEEKTPEQYTPRTKAGSIATADTSRTPITFTVSVEGWNELEIINE